MPLTPRDRTFLTALDRMKLMLVIMAALILVYLLMTPPGEMHTPTSVLALALCGVFWITQKLLGFISTLDFEIDQMQDTLRRSLTDEQRRQLGGSERS